MNPTRLIALVLVLLVVGPVALRGAESAGEAGAPSTTTANTESRRVVIGLSPFLPESAKEEVAPAASSLGAASHGARVL